MINRRTLVFGGAQAAAGTALLSRLYYLQFIKGDELKTEAEGNRIKVQLIIPPRGLITDRLGVIMAGNDVNYRLFVDRDAPAQSRKSVARVAKLLKWSKDTEKKLLDQIEIRDPKMCEQIKNLQFKFEDLKFCDLKSLKIY